MPPDAGLARLARRVCFHFLREHGFRALEARRRARAVERAIPGLLKPRAGARRDSSAALVLTLSSKDRSLEVIGRLGARGEARRLIRMDRPFAT